MKKRKISRAYTCILPIRGISGVPCPSYSAEMIKKPLPIRWTIILDAFCFTTIMFLGILKEPRAQNFGRAVFMSSG